MYKTCIVLLFFKGQFTQKNLMYLPSSHSKFYGKVFFFSSNGVPKVFQKNLLLFFAEKKQVIQNFV